MYVLCAVSIDGQTMYVDASGAGKASLGGSRWLSEKEALHRMKFAVIMNMNNRRKIC